MRYLDRFMMFYIRTADKLQRTSVWLESTEGGIDYLRKVIVDDKLGINEQLEADIARLREAVICEWKETVEHPETQLRFAHFINSPLRDRTCRWWPNVTNTARRALTSALPSP